MKILFITPDYFGSITDLLINLITAGVSIASLLITLMMYKAAIKALSTWKDQDKHNNVINLIKNAPEFQRLTYFLRKVDFSSMDQNVIDKIEVAYPHCKHQEKKHKHLQIKLINSKEQLKELNDAQIIAITSLASDHPVRKFYVLLNDTIEMMRKENLTYGFFVIQKDNYLQKRIEKIREIGNSIKPDENLQNDLREIEKSINNYSHLLNKLDPKLFSDYFQSDDFLNKIENCYKEVLRFRDAYNSSTS